MWTKISHTHCGTDDIADENMIPIFRKASYAGIVRNGKYLPSLTLDVLLARATNLWQKKKKLSKNPSHDVCNSTMRPAGNMYDEVSSDHESVILLVQQLIIARRHWGHSHLKIMSILLNINN